jgi:hypothetical protein
METSPRRTVSSPIVLIEPLVRYNIGELLAWTKQENIPIPRNVSRKQLIEIIENSSSVGGGGRIFRINPNSSSPNLSQIPPEITQEFLHYLPIENLIKFCRTSPKFSKYCRDSGFWRSKANYIHDKQQMLKILEDSLNHNVSSLAVIMLQKLRELSRDGLPSSLLGEPRDELTIKDLKNVFSIVMRSGKLSVIRKMIQIFETELPKLKNVSIGESMRIFSELIDPAKLGETIDIVYKLFVLDDFNHHEFQQILMNLGDQAIEYMLNHALQERNSRRFNLAFESILHVLFRQRNINKFRKYWDEYIKYWDNPDSLKQDFSSFDKYPYSFIKIVGGTVSSGNIIRDLQDAFNEDDYNLFVKIWNEWSPMIDERDMEGIASNFYQDPEFSEGDVGYGNKYLKVVRSGVFEDVVHELLWLAKEDAEGEFVKYWNLNGYYFTRREMENLVSEFEREGISEKYGELIMWLWGK